MSQGNQDFITNELIQYANNLEGIILKYAKYEVLCRKKYERKIQNLAQLSINKGIDIDDIAKEINQEKNNEKLIEKIKNNNNEKEKDINKIEINNISNQIYCKDFYNNLSQYLKRKKESLKISNVLNNNNKYNYGNNVNNKYKNQTEQNIYDSKKNNVYIQAEPSKTNVKYTGKKRKNK